MTEGGGIGPRSVSRATVYKAASSGQLVALHRTHHYVLDSFGIWDYCAGIDFGAALFFAASITSSDANRSLFTFRVFVEKMQQVCSPKQG
jgi:hypothetical protein